MRFPTSSLAIAFLIAASTPGSAQVADSAIRRIQDTKTLTIGHRETAAPFAFLDDAHQPAGYSIDLCRRVAVALAQTLKVDAIQTKFVPVSPQTRIPLLANGTVDLECGTTVNSLARQQQVDFSYPIALAEGKLLVRKDSGIHDLPDLQGKVVALVAGTTAERYIRTALDTNKIKARVMIVRDNAEGLIAVDSQRADAFINDAVLLGDAMRKSGHPDRFEVVGRPLSFEQVAIMVGKNNSGLLTAVNSVIARLARTGELEAMYGRWVVPYAGPAESEVLTMFKLESIPD